VPATIRTAIPAINQITFGHYTISLFHVKILPLLQVIGKTVAVSKNIVEITHKQFFFANLPNNYSTVVFNMTDWENQITKTKIQICSNLKIRIQFHLIKKVW